MIKLIISKNYSRESSKFVDSHIRFNGNFLKKSGKILLEYQKKIIGEIDSKRKIIRIFRNPETGRPLFYLYKNSKVFISDHIKFFIENNILLKENRDVLSELLIYGYVMPPNTIYEGIKRILIGEELIINLNVLTITRNSFISNIKKENHYSIKKIKSNLLKVLNKKEYTLLFSGGLDSSILLKLLLEKDYNIKVYSTGFEFEEVDILEKEYAISASKIFNVKTVYQTFDMNELLLNLPEIIRATEEPVVYIQTLLLYTLLKKNSNKCFKCIVNGQGADGVFGTSQQFNYLKNKKEVVLLKNIPPFLEKFNEIRNFRSRTNFITSLNNLDYLDKNFLLNLQGDTDLTTNCWAKCAEALKLKMIFPFLDNDLIKEVSKINWNIKLKEPKFLLRNLARKIDVPEEIIQKKKGSFGPISANWEKYFIRLKPLCYEIFPKKNVDCWFEDNEKRYFLWNLINYFLWKKLFIEHKNVAEIKSELKKLLY